MKKFIILFMIFAFLFVSCSKKEVEEKPIAPPKNVKAEIIKKEPEKKEDKNEVVDLFNRTPIATMIDNHWEARPQSGYSSAKLIYEAIAEGNITRMIFLTDDQDATMGPVRSARPYYIRAMAEWDAFYAHVGTSVEATELIWELSIKDFDNFVYSEPIFWRRDHKEAPHNAYMSTKALYERAKSEGYSVDKKKNITYPLKTNTVAQKIEGQEATNIELDYGYSEYLINYKYDEKNKGYLKYYNQEKVVDEANQKDAVFTNIIVQQAQQYAHSDGIHTVIETVGSGKGYYFSQGKVIPIKWSKEDDTAPTKFIDIKTNKELVLNPGLTIINILSDSIEVKYGK